MSLPRRQKERKERNHSLIGLMIWVDRRGSASCVHPDVCPETDRHQFLRATRHLQTRIARLGLGTRYRKFSLPSFSFLCCSVLQTSLIFESSLTSEIWVLLFLFYVMYNITWLLLRIIIHEFFTRWIKYVYCIFCFSLILIQHALSEVLNSQLPDSISKSCDLM